MDDVTGARFDEFIAALRQPSLYPGRPESVRFVETHASAVFIVGDDVYKLKKPVDFGFLDYSTLDQRRVMCQLEVQLNRRLAPSVYHGVIEIVRGSKGIQFGGEGDVVDYLVHMRRLPDDATLAAHVERDDVSGNQIDGIAQRIAEFHRDAARNPQIDRWGRPSAIEHNIEENFEQVQPYAGLTIPQETFARIATSARGFLADNHELLDQRVHDGLVRDGHGDIRSEHVYLLDEVTIIDCIEFNDRMRYGDVATDIGFLAMDLDARNRPDLADRLISIYTDASGFDVGPVLDFYRCYRAFVRGKVTSFRLDQDDLAKFERIAIQREARRYFHLAYRYAVQERGPRLFVMCGLTGSGKSTLARELGGVLPATVIDSDSTRKRLAGLAPTERQQSTVGAGIYSQEMSAKVYRELLDQADDQLSRGQSVILDATYIRYDDRLAARDLAAKHGATFRIVHCLVSDDLVRDRLRLRAEDAASVSDGTWEVYLAQRDTADPVIGDEEPITIDIDSSRDIQVQTEDVLQRLESDIGPASGSITGDGE